MKIAALINIVPDIEQLPKEEWNIDKIDNLDTNYIPKTFDIYNDTLVEMILRYKKELNNNINFSILSLGNSSIDYYLKNLYSYNINNIIKIERENSLLTNSDSISNDLYSYLKENTEFDIILAGKKGMLYGSGLTGYKLANKLNYKIINNIIAIRPKDEDYGAIISYIQNNEIITKEINFPFIGLVGDVPEMFLQVPSLKQKLIGKKKAIEYIYLNKYKKNLYSNLYDGNCTRENQSRNGIFYKHNTIEESIKYLEDEIDFSKKEALNNNVLPKTYLDKKIYIFTYNDIKIYFCFNDNKYYNEFIQWNLKKQNKLFLDINDVIFNNSKIILKRKIYADNLITNISLPFESLFNPHKQKIISFCGNNDLLNKIIRVTDTKGKIADDLIENLNSKIKISNNNKIISKIKTPSFDDIKNEKAIIAIGLGIKNKKNLKAIKDFAKKNNINIVGTRQAAMNNFVPLENMIGISGKQISPNLLICIGLSGAPAFYEGIKNSKKIISINNDINAHIMENSDIKINIDLAQIFGY